MKHQHKADKTRQEFRAYTGGVSRDQEPRAHGGCCIVDRCRCGAYRKTNSNAGYLELGPWIECAAKGES